MKDEIKRYAGENASVRRVRALSKRFEKVFGPFVPKKMRDPVEELILTVLSQATSDTNRNRAFESLMNKYKSWDEIMNAPVKSVEAAIKSGGLARNKSRAIKKILKEVLDRYGGWNLGDIGTMPIDDAVKELTSFPGVGVKTAACVLVFAYGRPVIPVDTHVHRLSARLGLTGRKVSAENTYKVLMDITPDELKYPFHLQVIKYGRTVCKAQRPRCEGCAVREMCVSKGEW